MQYIKYKILKTVFKVYDKLLIANFQGLNKTIKIDRKLGKMDFTYKE